MHHARVDQFPTGLVVEALRPQAVIITPVEPFEAAERSMSAMTISIDAMGTGPNERKSSHCR